MESIHFCKAQLGVHPDQGNNTCVFRQHCIYGIKVGHCLPSEACLDLPTNSLAINGRTSAPRCVPNSLCSEAYIVKGMVLTGPLVWCTSALARTSIFFSLQENKTSDI